jgi:hypothetical protein
MAFVGKGNLLMDPAVWVYIHQLLGGVISKIMMIESPEWSRITAYAAENIIKMTIEAIESQEDMAFEATNSVQNELATNGNASITGNN